MNVDLCIISGADYKGAGPFVAVGLNSPVTSLIAGHLRGLTFEGRVVVALLNGFLFVRGGFRMLLTAKFDSYVTN